jgi:hypothetical protein
VTSAVVGGASVWVGLTDADEEGHFRWIDGTDPVYTAWNGGEPNDWGGNEDCTEVYAGGAWNDLDCLAGRAALCEDPCDASADADGDGALSCVNDCDDGDPETFPGAPDLCGDGLDQDCSGLADDAADCPLVCSDLAVAGATFTACRSLRTWGEARALCLARGQDLAWLSSLAQVFEVRARLALGPGAELSHWIGLTSFNLPSVPGTHVWLTGSAPGFDGWADGQPNGNGPCVRLRPDALWDDTPCDRRHAVLCRSPGVE